MSSPHDVVISGIGLVSSLGEGSDAHWHKLAQSGLEPVLETERFAPYTVHPLPEIDWNLQIAKRGDQRQMETWQRLGTYAAGLALDDAGIKGNDELCATMDMVVAAGGGERDEAVDAAILAASESRNDRDVLLNEKLTTELRPTLFLAQLSNLLAGNIAIVHGVTGPSRTFMGEEQAGVDAVRTAHARIASGQSDLMLVGGAYNAERRDMLLLFELGGYLHRDDFKPVFERESAPGLITGSAGAFLVLESAERAAARGAKAYAKLKHTGAARSRREAGTVQSALTTLLGGFGPVGGDALAISAATGCAGITGEEAAAITAAAPSAKRIAAGDLVGHGVEAAFPVSVALAAIALSAGQAREAIVTGAGHWRGEGAAHLVQA